MQWLDHPKRTFNEALTICFKSFGIHGFEDIVNNKTKALEKEYYKIVWKSLTKDCTFNFGIWLLLSTLIFVFYTLWQDSIYLLPLVASILGFIKFKTIKNKVRLHNESVPIVENQQAQPQARLQVPALKAGQVKPSGNKKWLLQDIIQRGGSYLILFNFLFPLVYLTRIGNYAWNIPIALFFGTFLFIGYFIFWKLPKQQEEILLNRYPILFSIK